MQLAQATVTVDLAKIEGNARMLVEALPGVGIVGVTKVTCGSPEIALAMLAGGVVALGESRLENAARLREAGVTAPIWLVRAPSPATAAEAVRVSDVSVVSEIAIVEALDAAASRAGRRYGILAMVDIGDLRPVPSRTPTCVRRSSAPGWCSMRSHDPRVAFVDVLRAGAEIERFLHGRSLAEYESDRLVSSAVERQFEIIGEALTRALQADPSIEGRLSEARNVIGFRNRLAHGYDTVDDRLVWALAIQKLPALLAVVRDALGEGLLDD